MGSRDWRRDPVRTEKTVFVFMHVPKTGGTTFTRQILRSYDREEVLLYNPEGDGRLPVDARPTWVCGHHPFSWYGYHSSNEVWTSLFRNPEDRVVSHYFDVLSRRYPGGVPKNPVPSLDDFLAKDTNRMTRFLATTKLGPEWEDERNKGMFGRALLNLRKLDVVGVQERYDEFVRRVEDRVGRVLAPAQKANVGVRPSVEDLDPAIVEKIREANRWDLLLYDAAKEIAA